MEKRNTAGCSACWYRPPRHVQVDCRPVSGLASGFPRRITFPRRAQWCIDSPWLAYRCGGSAGLVIVMTHRLPVSSLERTFAGHLQL